MLVVECVVVGVALCHVSCMYGGVVGNLSGYLLRNLRESIRDFAFEVLDSVHVMS